MEASGSSVQHRWWNVSTKSQTPCASNFSRKTQSQSEAVSVQVCSSTICSTVLNCVVLDYVQLIFHQVSPGFLHTPYLLSTTRRSSNSHKTGSCFRSWQQLFLAPESSAIQWFCSSLPHFVVILSSRMKARKRNDDESQQMRDNSYQQDSGFLPEKMRTSTMACTNWRNAQTTCAFNRPTPQSFSMRLYIEHYRTISP